MKWYAEITEWRDDFGNGIYLLDDAKSKMYAYRPSETAPIKTFRSAIRIDIRGRKFKVNPVQFRVGIKEEQPEGRVIEVRGSRGDMYQVSELNGHFSCTCSGFKFRGSCKHIKELRGTDQITS